MDPARIKAWNHRIGVEMQYLPAPFRVEISCASPVAIYAAEQLADIHSFHASLSEQVLEWRLSEAGLSALMQERLSVYIDDAYLRFNDYPVNSPSRAVLEKLISYYEAHLANSPPKADSIYSRR